MAEIRCVSVQFTEKKKQNTQLNWLHSTGMWVHVEGDNTPEFDSDGFVTAPDNTGVLISDLRRFCDLAAEYNVFVILSLWTGASIRQDNTYSLFMDDRRLQSYIDNALVVI